MANALQLGLLKPSLLVFMLLLGRSIAAVLPRSAQAQALSCRCVAAALALRCLCVDGKMSLRGAAELPQRCRCVADAMSSAQAMGG